MKVEEFAVLSQKLKERAAESLNAGDFEAAKIYVDEIMEAHHSVSQTIAINQ